VTQKTPQAIFFLKKKNLILEILFNKKKKFLKEILFKFIIQTSKSLLSFIFMNSSSISS
jgi:hypothetical protein